MGLRAWGRRLASMEFRLATPLLHRGPLGLSFMPRHHSGSAALKPILPDAKSLIGRARWLLRASLIGSVFEEHPGGGVVRVSNHQQAETLAQAFGSTRSASPLIVRVSWEISNSISPAYLQPQDLSECGAEKGSEIFRMLGKIGGRILGGKYTDDPCSGQSQQELGGCVNLCSNGSLSPALVEAAMAAAVPRIQLSTHTSKAQSKILSRLIDLYASYFNTQSRGAVEALLRQPARPGSLTMKVEVVERPGARLSGGED
nr:hypothetical protein [Desulfurococcales archaeon]